MGVLVCFYVIQRFYFRPISHFHLQKIPNSEMIAKYLSLKPLGNFALGFVSAMSKKKKNLCTSGAIMAKSTILKWAYNLKSSSLGSTVKRVTWSKKFNNTRDDIFRLATIDSAAPDCWNKMLCKSINDGLLASLVLLSLQMV